MITYLLDELLSNQALFSSLVAWFFAQSLKTVIDLIRYKKLDLERMVGSGGFPSAHSALVTALATTIGLSEGLRSNLFAMALIFAFIVMYDASGVRRAAGKQAKILNYIIQHHKEMKSLWAEVPLLKELLGHTPIEVFGGALLGVIVALALYQ